MYKFKVGDKVQIKEWDEMEKEFGLNRDGNISCYCVFTDCMRACCGKRATVTKIFNEKDIDLEFENGWNPPWGFSTDMIKPYQFTKADLKNGMVFETRNEDRYMFINGNGIGLNGYVYGASFTDDLKCRTNKNFDIMKVFETTAMPFGSMLNYGHLIWERKEPKVKELTTAEAISLLKEKFTDFDEVKIVN